MYILNGLSLNYSVSVIQTQALRYLEMLKLSVRATAQLLNDCACSLFIPCSAICGENPILSDASISDHYGNITKSNPEG